MSSSNGQHGVFTEDLRSQYFLSELQSHSSQASGKAAMKNWGAFFSFHIKKDWNDEQVRNRWASDIAKVPNEETNSSSLINVMMVWGVYMTREKEGATDMENELPTMHKSGTVLGYISQIRKAFEGKTTLILPPAFVAVAKEMFDRDWYSNFRHTLENLAMKECQRLHIDINNKSDIVNREMLGKTMPGMFRRKMYEEMGSIMMLFSGCGRGGEVKHQKVENLIWDNLLGALIGTWEESKIVRSYQLNFVFDVNYEMDILFILGCMFLMEGEGVGDNDAKNPLFPSLNVKWVTSKVSGYLKSGMRDAGFNVDNITARSLRRGAAEQMVWCANLPMGLSIKRGGWENPKHDMLLEYGVSDIASILPTAKVLAGHEPYAELTAPRIDALVTEDDKTKLLSLADAAFRRKHFQRNQRGYELATRMIASLVMRYNDIVEDHSNGNAPHEVVARLRALLGWVMGPKVPPPEVHKKLQDWSKRIKDDHRTCNTHTVDVGNNIELNNSLAQQAKEIAVIQNNVTGVKSDMATLTKDVKSEMSRMNDNICALYGLVQQVVEKLSPTQVPSTPSMQPSAGSPPSVMSTTISPIAMTTNGGVSDNNRNGGSSGSIESINGNGNSSSSSTSQPFSLPQPEQPEQNQALKDVTIHMLLRAIVDKTNFKFDGPVTEAITKHLPWFDSNTKTNSGKIIKLINFGLGCYIPGKVRKATDTVPFPANVMTEEGIAILKQKVPETYDAVAKNLAVERSGVICNFAKALVTKIETEEKKISDKPKKKGTNLVTGLVNRVSTLHANYQNIQNGSTSGNKRKSDDLGNGGEGSGGVVGGEQPAKKGGGATAAAFLNFFK